ncbi:MAG TPA: galactofuranose ABC transporter, permease protein YjfF [Chthoniobacteraceae bacterium]|jgi:simple sugar transport system permease protein
MNRKHIPLLTTAAVLVVLFISAAAMYHGFGSMRVVANLVSDNAVLGVTAVGMTFVILSGGIDLSVGSIVAFTTVLVATLVGKHGMHPLLAMLIAVMLGAAFGWGQGVLVDRYDVPAFLVTLGGMFFARGMAFVVTMESVGIKHPFYSAIQDLSIPIGPRAWLSSSALIFLVVFAVGVFVAHLTVFGRNVYALGGNAESARLMGLPVARIRPAVYAVSGFCSALAGVVATIYTGSGNPAASSGLELDAIAAVVIGGTLLTGGVGYVVGTLLGVLIFGTIQSALAFDGRLNSWWLRIAVGTLLLAFILLQRFLTRSAGKRASATA